MSLSTPRVSFVIASRNDQWCGDSVGRLSNTLNWLMNFFDEEIILVDWGTPTKDPLRRALKLENHRPDVRMIYVPREIATDHFSEVLALNVGIRRAKGTYIARLDQDTMPGMKFRGWLNELPDNPNNMTPAYFSERRDMALGDTPGTLIRRWSDPPWDDSYKDFFKTAVGVLIAPKIAWHNLTGYDESLIYRNHMEHDLCARFRRTCGLVNLGPIVEYDFYHQFHERSKVYLKDNDFPSDKWMEECPLRPNGIDWGLGNVKLEERYL